MLKIIEVRSKEVFSYDRLEPEFWIIREIVNKILAKHKHNALEEYSISIKKGIFDLKASKYRNHGIPFLRISNLKYFEMGTEDLVYISEEDNKINNNTILTHGDIAFSKIGTLGKILRIGTRFSEVNISQNLIGMRMKKEVNKNYIFAYLLSKFALLQIEKNKKKQLQDKLNLIDIRQLQVIELPNTEVKAIGQLVEEAEILAEESYNKIDTAKKIFYKNINIDFSSIDKCNTFSSRKSELLLENIWTPAYSNPLYKNTLRLIQKSWKMISLGEIVTIKKGDEVGSANYSKYLYKNTGDIPFVRTSDIVNFEVDQFPDFYVSKDIFHSINQDIILKDILFSNDGKIGLVAMLTEQDNIIIQSHVRRIRLNQKAKQYNITAEYLFILLTIEELTKYQVKKYTVVQSTIPTISNNLEKFQIPLLDKKTIESITLLVKQAYIMKDNKKKIIKEAIKKIDDHLGLE